jgi:hypothetical protein
VDLRDGMFKVKFKKSGGYAMAVVERHWPFRWTPVFDPRQIDMGFVVDKVEMGLPVSVFLCRHSTSAPNLFIHLLTNLYDLCS